MMRGARPPLLLLVLAIPGAASAQPRTDTQAAALHQPAVEPTLPGDGTQLYTWSVDAVAAQLTRRQGDATALEGTVSATGEISFWSRERDTVTLGAQLGASVGGDVPLTAAAWITTSAEKDGVIYSGDTLFEWDVTPALLARPRMPAGPNRRETVVIGQSGRTTELRPGDFDLGSPPRAWYVTGACSGHYGFGWEQDGTLRDIGLGGELRVFGFRRASADDGGEPFELWLMTFGAETLGPGLAEAPFQPWPATLTLDPVRVTGLQLGGWTIAARAGVAALDVDAGRGRANQQSLVVTPTTAIDLERDAGGGRVRLAAERTAWSLWDGRGAIDDRVTVGVAGAAGRLRVRSDLFGAVTHLVAPAGAIARGATGGVTAIAETDLGARLRLRLRSDLGRGFYAAGATFDEPRWAAEVLATVSFHTGSQ